MSKFLKQLGAVLGVGVVALAGGYGAGQLGQPDTSSFASQASLDVLKAQVTADHLVLGNLSVTSVNTQSIISDIQADDMWESAAEGLALIELQDDSYEALENWLSNRTLSNIDFGDIVSVQVEDTSFSLMDTEEQDGTVVFDLKVRYENISDNRRTKLVTATAILKDGEVTSLTFA